MLCLILLDSFVDVGLERKGTLLCMRLRLILLDVGLEGSEVARQGYKMNLSLSYFGHLEQTIVIAPFCGGSRCDEKE